jgi:GTP-binding protein
VSRTPIVAIVGRPNVGKSTLFNRLIRERKALVLDMPGVTRDRIYGRVEAYNREFIVIDTGGFEPESEEGMLPAMRRQAEMAIEEADLTLFMVDGRAGLTPIDEQIFRILRTSRHPVVVCVNKVEGPKQDLDVLEFHGLGVDELFAISSEHGRNIGDLLDRVIELLPPETVPPGPEVEGEDGEDEEDANPRTRIAVIGRPNSGKSTIINRLLGQERLIVSDVAGTTRDSIDTDFNFNGKPYTLIDTVGMRRRRSIDLAVEQFGVMKAMQSVERCHVAVLMMDATEEMSDQDARIANLAVKSGRGLIIVLNKWDIVVKNTKTASLMQTEIRESRKSLGFAPILTLSALTGQRSGKLMETVEKVAANWRRRVPTGELNRWFDETLQHRPPPLYKRRSVKVYYVTQARSRPPTFVLMSNMAPDSFPESYLRFLGNQLREAFSFEGSPVNLVIRQRKSKYKSKPKY